ncbi:MAG: TRAP transporter small permease [Candidatus Accumulibacter sp.]|nr:TRAP transporter small permease [Accumulibacter sp.]
MTGSSFIGRLGRLLALAMVMSRAAVWAGGALTIASVLLVSCDVIVRRVFGVTFGGANELSSYAFAISISWAMAFTALERANVRVDVLYRRFPVRVGAVLDWLALIVLGVFAAYLTWYAWDITITSWTDDAAANSPLGTPLWIPQSLWALGLAWFFAVLALLSIRATVALATGDLAALRAVCGARTTQEEAEEEAAAGARIVEEERGGQTS